MGLQSNFGYKLSILAFIVIFSTSSLASQGAICPIESIYLFGDSISDTGNLIRIIPGAAASRQPYGETFPGHPTGRWSDGRLTIDYIAKSLGLPLLNPYLDKKASFENGVNFAVAGATTLDALFLSSRKVITVPVPSLRTQLGWFQRHLTTICSHQTDCRRYQLNNSLVFVGEIGYNDIAYAYSEGRSLQLIQSYLPRVNQVIIETARDVIRAGAHQVVVPGLFPLGCFPFALNATRKHHHSTYDANGCLKDLNDLIASRNNDLQGDLNNLRKEFPDATILYSDLYNAFLTLLRSAPALDTYLGINFFYAWHITSSCV